MVIKGPGFQNGIIILEEPEAVYYSGQVLSGNVHFELNETLTYSAINLVCLGEASIQRPENQYEMSGGTNRYREVVYEGREQYFNFAECVSGGSGVSTLPPGVHSIPFQYQIPINAPSSFKGEDAVILYCITAYLEYPEPGRREELIKEFRVVAPIGHSTLANMMQPLQLDFEEIETCNCFCESKPIDMKITLPSRAFHVGSIIPINVKVQNDSTVEIYEVCFTITKRHTYRTQRPRSEYTAPEETLVEMKKASVLLETQYEHTWHLPLPSAVLPNLEACSIIDVVYLFKVKIQMTLCSEDIEDESEIFIGVLPHTDAFEVTSPDLILHLPKAPVPEPNQTFGLITSGQNYASNSHNSQQFGAPLASTISETTLQKPYEIGFRSTTGPVYPAGNTTSGYPAYPAMAPTAPGHHPPPYPSGQPPYNFNTQPNIVPSAPPP